VVGATFCGRAHGGQESFDQAAQAWGAWPLGWMLGSAPSSAHAMLTSCPTLSSWLVVLGSLDRLGTDGTHAAACGHPSSINDELEARRPAGCLDEQQEAGAQQGARAVRLGNTNSRRPTRTSPGMKVLVTGATGFMGGRLCAALAGAGDHGVHAFVLRGLDASGLPPSVEAVYGDVTDEESLAAAFRGRDAVFHTAAAVEAWLPDASVFHTVR